MKKRSELADEIAKAILVDALKFALNPVKEKPRKMAGWGTSRFKKTDKWRFKGKYRVDLIE